jgi:hypothetical protein
MNDGLVAISVAQPRCLKAIFFAAKSDLSLKP